MQIIDLFSGIGGFSLAGRWMGWETIQFCEIDKYCQGILNQHFPNVPIHNNIKTLKGEQIKTKPNEPIILVGGFPCQPYSVAGKRKGKEDERHLFPEMLRIIREVRPQYVVGENVAGIVSWDGGLVFEEVQSDLEAEGYEVQAFILPAVSVGAPHRRDRVWFIAKNTNRSFNGGLQTKRNKWQHRHFSPASKMGNGNVTNTACLRCKHGRNNWQKRYIQRNKWFATKNKQEWNRRFGWLGKACNVTNTHLQRCAQPNLSTFNAKQGYNGKFNNAAIPNWDEFPTQSPICGRNDGISNRVDRIKALGNAIVPQVALQIFKAIQEIENNY